MKYAAFLIIKLRIYNSDDLSVFRGNIFHIENCSWSKINHNVHYSNNYFHLGRANCSRELIYSFIWLIRLPKLSSPTYKDLLLKPSIVFAGILEKF